MKLIWVTIASVWFTFFLSSCNYSQNKVDIQKNQKKIATLRQKLNKMEKKLEHITSLSKTRGSQENHKPKQQSIWTKREKKISSEIVEDLTTRKKQLPSNTSRLIGKDFSHLRFVTSTGQVLDLNQYRNKKNVLLVVLRGFAGSVCIVCSSQTLALSKTIEKFKEKNTEVILVYPGKPESISPFLESVKDLQGNFAPPFSIVLDVDLNLVDNFKIQGDLAKPTSIIIDKSGFIRYTYVGKHPGDRPNIKSLLAQLDKINKGT